MILAIGDTHGHLQLALAGAARWQAELGAEFEAVLLCGDVGSFASDDQLDSTTRWGPKLARAVDAAPASSPEGVSAKSRMETFAAGTWLLP